jgi:hypothetical protein
MALPIDPDARFKRAKQQAAQEQNAQTEAQKEALQRRFAAGGMLSSGEALKAEQLADKQGQGQLAKRVGDIESVQEQSALQRQEVEQQRAFQRGEREAGQKFSAQERAAQMAFARGEREAGQQFGLDTMAMQQKYATGEREAGQEFQKYMTVNQQKFTSKENKLARKQAADQFASQMKFSEKQFAYDQEITNQNLEWAREDRNKKDMFDNIGNFGTDAWKGFTGGGFQGAGGGFATGIDTIFGGGGVQMGRGLSNQWGW